mgnify:FL=1
MSLEVKVVFRAEGATNVIAAIQKLRGEEQKLSTTTGATKKQFDRLGEALDKNTRATKRLANSNEDATKKMGLFSRQLRGVRGGLAKFRSITLIAAFAVNFLDRTLGALTRAAKEQQLAVARLNQTLKSTNFAARVTSKELQVFAARLQKLTGIGDETILAMQGILLTFTQIRGQVFKDATKAILDVSEAMGQDLQQTAIQVGKALNDPILGVSALSRVGIQFTNVQKEQIKQFARGGEMAKAQGIILKELQVQFGGTAANLDSTTFQVRRLQSAFSDFLETGGGKLRPFVETIAKALANLFENMNTPPDAAFQQFLNAADDDLKGFLQTNQMTTEQIEFLQDQLKLPTFSLLDLQDAEEFNKIMFAMRSRISELRTGIDPTDAALNIISASFVNSRQSVADYIDNINESSQSMKINATNVMALAERVDKLAETGASLDDQFLMFVGGGLEEMVSGLNLTTQEAFNLAKGYSILDKIFADGRITVGGTKDEMLKLQEAFQKFPAFIEENGEEFSAYNHFIRQIVNGQIEFVDENGKLANSLMVLLPIIQSIAAGFGNAETSSKGFGEKVKELKSFLKENDAQFDKTLANLQSFAAENSKTVITLLQVRKALAIGNMILAFSEMSTKGFKGFLLGMSILAKGMAQIAQFDSQISAAKAAAASAKSGALGMDMIADRPQFIKVGDNPQLRERVTVTPIGSPNVRGGGASEVVVNLNGNILGTEEFVRDTLIPQLEDSLGRNLA